VNLNIGDILGGLAAIITAIILLARAFKTTPHEVNATDADIVSKYEAIVASAANRADRTDKRMDEMETSYQDDIKALHDEQKILLKRITELEKINLEKDRCIEDLENKLTAALVGREDRETRITELEKKVEQLEEKAQ
jgi:chromosome segregation ATPase